MNEQNEKVIVAPQDYVEVESVNPAIGTIYVNKKKVFGFHKCCTQDLEGMCKKLNVAVPDCATCILTDSGQAVIVKGSLERVMTEF